MSTAHTNLTGPGFVYVGQELRFLGPVFIDDTLTIEVKVVERKEGSASSCCRRPCTTSAASACSKGARR